MKRLSLACAASTVAAILVVLATTASAAAPDLETTIADLQHRWAAAKYRLADEEQQEAALAALAKDAHAAAERFPGRAEPLVWEGIILATEAGVKGGLSALSLVKEARDRLSQAAAIDADALEGSIYTSLGSLYYQVPGWPLSFGDNKKARAYLKKALSLNPDGIDPNYFWGDFLLETGDYAGARKAFEKALAAPDRPDRPLADAGRRAEARRKLAEAEAHL